MLTSVILLLHVICAVTSLDFTPFPSRFVIGDTGTLTMRCNNNEADVKKVYNIIIKRESAPDANYEQVLAAVDTTNDAHLDDDITNDKDFVVTGSLTESTPYIQVTMNIQKMVCEDARIYFCQSFFLSNSDSAKSAKKNATLEAFVLPTMISPLDARKNGLYVEGGDEINKAQFDVGDHLVLTCRANIGSRKSTKIQWRKTSEIDDKVFSQYQPAANTLNETDSLSDNQCGYTRTSTLYYNVTASDAAYDLAFECYVSVTGYPTSTLTPGGSYETTNNLRYYVDVSSSTTPSSTGNTAENTYVAGAERTTGANGSPKSVSTTLIVGITLGVVCVFLGIVAVYFIKETYTLRRRARKFPDSVIGGQELNTAAPFGEVTTPQYTDLSPYANIADTYDAMHRIQGD